MLLATLGDSVSCGEGVGLRVPLERTWVGLLAAAMPGTEHLALAAPGARTHEVRRDQLPTAVLARPELATVATGLNDVTRAGFDAAQTYADLRHCVSRLLDTGAHVLVVRLHDPTRQLPLPPALRRAVQMRVTAVNAAVDAAAGARVPVLDLEQVPLLRTRAAWAVDRMHPSALGHAAIASAAAQVLRDGGWFVRPLQEPAPLPDPGRVAEVSWLVRHGLPWLASHGRQVGVPLLAMTARGGEPTAA